MTSTATRAIATALTGVAATATIIGAGSAIYQSIAEALDRRRYPAPGQIIRVGHRRLHLWCQGTGNPTVVVLPALGTASTQWASIQRALTPVTRVCLYDRGGLGWSEHVPGPRTADVLADELHDLLEAADVPPPYVLVGHSYGGMIARLYAARHRERLAGLVLVDSSHEDQMTRLATVLGWREASLNMWLRALRLRLQPFGLLRAGVRPGLTDQYRRAAERECVPELVNAGLAFALSSRHRRAGIREMTGFRRGTKQVQAEAGKLGDVPVTVLTSSECDPNHSPGSPAAERRQRWYPMWAELQADLSTLSTNSRHVVAERAGHHIHLDQPALVIEAIRDICTLARAAQRRP